jgi:hypothetical protein
VNEAIDTALRSEPEQRWQNASEMRRCLVSFASDEFDIRSLEKPLAGKHPRVERTQEGT